MDPLDRLALLELVQVDLLVLQVHLGLVVQEGLPGLVGQQELLGQVDLPDHLAVECRDRVDHQDLQDQQTILLLPLSSVHLLLLVLLIM